MHADLLFSIVALIVLLGCTPAEAHITPISTLGAPTVAQAETLNPKPKSIALPTPQIQTAAHGYYQDDDGLRLAIAAVNTKAISPSNQDERNFQYLVLTLVLTNFSSQPKDVTGFPLTILIRDVQTQKEIAPELYAPSENGMWQMIDKLNTGTVKDLGENQTLRGELFFQTPASASQFDLIWQPDVQRQWILSIPKLRSR